MTRSTSDASCRNEALVDIARNRHLGQKFAFLRGRRTATADRIMASNMENPGKRLIVLEGDEVEALYGRPCFTHEERVQDFTPIPQNVREDMLRMSNLSRIWVRVSNAFRLTSSRELRRLALR